MKTIYLIYQIIEWYDGEKTKSPVFAVSDEIDARIVCKRNQIKAYEEDDKSLYRKLYIYENITLYL